MANHRERGLQSADLFDRSFLLDIITTPIVWLLVALPIAVGIHGLAPDQALGVFLASGLAIVPLAALMGRATENLSETLGAGVGGLLNATFGNAAELILALMALRMGPSKYDLVKASITGSIIGNILLVLGLAIAMGGFRYERQKFNRTAASMGACLMTLAAIGLLVPTLFYYIFQASAPGEKSTNIEFLSEEIAFILLGVYVLSLIFSLRTHRHLFAGDEEKLPTTGPAHQPEWNRRTSIAVLLLATLGVAWMSELLVGSVEVASHAMGLTPIFVGVIVVAVVGNAAEHSTAVLVAMKNKMDLAVNIAVGSGIQIALFVAPALVFASMLMNPGQPMDLHFTPMEAVAIVLSVVVLNQSCNDGESHWMEGVLMLAVYVILALAFYHLPG